jgi:hypothetical protein
LLPKLAHDIAIWMGGSSEAAYRRAADRGDGFQALGRSPEQFAPVIARLRRARPDPTFVLSLRTGWDPQGMERDTIRRGRDAFQALGVQHILAAPWQTAPDNWLGSLAEIDGAAEQDPGARS